MRTQSAERSETTKNDETRIAEEIVSVLPAGIARACSADRTAIRYTVRGEGMKLQSIVLRRSSLRRLAEDPARRVKIEYLQRDLLEAAAKRPEFRYPRLSHFVQVRRFALGLPVASMI